MKLKAINWKHLKGRVAAFRWKMRQPAPVPSVDETQHICRHCGYNYVGRQCPMCGMPGDWQRFGWNHLFGSVLDDILNVGQRPMFRTMGHLITRPGYMIRDYLNGHYLSYFPPFKMLTFLTVVFALLIWMLGIDMNEGVQPMEEAIGELNNPANPFSSGIVRSIYQIRDFFAENHLYRLLVQITFMVVAMWITFKKWKLNLVEIFYVMVYITCQMLMLSLVLMLLTGEVIQNTLLPFALPEVIVILILIYDFRQLFGLRFWQAVGRTLLMLLNLFLLGVGFVLVVLVVFLTITYMKVR